MKTLYVRLRSWSGSHHWYQRVRSGTALRTSWGLSREDSMSGVGPWRGHVRSLSHSFSFSRTFFLQQALGSADRSHFKEGM